MLNGTGFNPTSKLSFKSTQDWCHRKKVTDIIFDNVPKGHEIGFRRMPGTGHYITYRDDKDGNDLSEIKKEMIKNPKDIEPLFIMKRFDTKA